MLTPSLFIKNNDAMKEHKISWLNVPGFKPETWNPILGCSKTSPGCDNCYAERMAHRLSNISATSYYKYVTNKNGKWNGRSYFHEEVLSNPSRWKKPRAVFVNSMGDLFHESISFDWVDRVFNEMEANPQHLFFVLTKRAERMFEYTIRYGPGAFPKNIWWGVTAENQEQADKRIPFLYRIATSNTFVSCEPLLGYIDLIATNKPTPTECPVCHEDIDVWDGLKVGSVLPCVKCGSDLIVSPHSTNVPWFESTGLGWILVGGESGKNARPANPNWVMGLKEYAGQRKIPFHFKQWGEWFPSHEVIWMRDKINREKYEANEIVSEGIPFWRVGRKKAGANIIGQEIKEFPIINL